MFALAFLQASIASLLTGAGAWLLLRAAARLWPALEAHRTPWLLATAAAAASLAIGLLPPSARPSIVPAIELPAVLAGAPSPLRAAHAAAAGAQPAGAMDDDAATDDHGAMPQPLEPAPALRWLGHAWLAIYMTGLLAALTRWLRARRRLHALLAAAQPLDRFALAAHPGFASLHRALPEVREIDAPIAPMLAWFARPVLLLPRHLRDFDPAQQRLVIEHELTHLARRDPLWMHASFALQVIQWFNPMVARLGRHMAWAQELGCDRAVLQGRPSAQRRAYAAALVAQMRMQAMPDQATALAFGGSVVDAVSARIGMIRDGVPAMPRAVAGALGWAALPALLATSVLLQPALAWRLDAASATPPAAAPTAPAPIALASPHTGHSWQAPMDRLRVSAFFGVQHTPTRQPHGGMDFAAPAGTPVKAPADGVVLTSTSRYMNQPKYGEVIAIRHANGLRTVYAHLDERMVKEGDKVSAGQQIGTSGASGKVTGPHLHLEVSRDGANIDPQLLLGNLEANATKTALARLKASRAP